MFLESAGSSWNQTHGILKVTINNSSFGLAAGQNLDFSVHFINPPRSRSMTVSVLPCLFLFP